MRNKPIDDNGPDDDETDVDDDHLQYEVIERKSALTSRENGFISGRHRNIKIISKNSSTSTTGIGSEVMRYIQNRRN